MPEKKRKKTDCYLYDKGSDFKIIRYTRGCSTTKKPFIVEMKAEIKAEKGIRKKSASA